MRMFSKHTFLLAMGIAVAALVADATTARAQLAPTGSHYGARASDTGHSSVTGTGGYSTAVPLALNPSRGGLPVPLAVTHVGRGVGAAGLGWDVPLSFVRRDTTVARRRPAFQPGGDVAGREQITVSIGGRTIPMMQRDPGTWVARQDAPDLELRSDGPNTWRLLDGAGTEYVFTSPAAPIPDLWLLDSISGAGNVNRVKLGYQTAAHNFTNPSAFQGAGHSIDLVEIKYNTHPTQVGCFKDVVRLAYNPDEAKPLHVSLLGSAALFRMRTLREITIARTEGCSTESAVARYHLHYADDPDTAIPRLHKVRVSGRDGSTELPVAEYGYGTASNSERKLSFQRGPDIALPADIGAVQILASTYHDGDASTPDGGETYVSWHNIIDINGDGRADLVFKKNNQLWVAINRPDGSSHTTLVGGPSKLLAPANDNRPMAEHSSETLRYNYNWQTRSQEWRKILDVNGDGRLDIIDAEESDGEWVVYLNTPGDPVTWVKRRINTAHIKAELESMGHEIDGDRVPLSRKTSGFDTEMSECWIWSASAGRYVHEPYTFPNLSLCEFDPATTVSQQIIPDSYEKTFVEWMLKDVNGDGYPDVVFNHSPVTREDVLGRTDLSTFWRVDIVRRRLMPEISRSHVLLNVAGVRLHTDNVFSAPLRLGGPDCVPESWGGTTESPRDEQWIVCALEDVNGDGVLDRVAGGYAYLGAGNPAVETNVIVPMAIDGQPTRFARSYNGYHHQCVTANAPEMTEITSGALRDMNGDGIPDLVHGGGVSFGTGTGFAAPISIKSDVFALSQSVDHCAGEYSRTTHGLYDIDGDGKPEVVKIAHNPARLEVYYLTGGADGSAAAGRLTSIDNGYGAITRIKYRSAKDYGSAVPFPEIVVTSVETTDSLGLGGSLSAVHYAYGGASMYFDPAADSFTTRGYERVVEVYGTGLEEWQADFAIIRLDQPLTPYTAGMSDAERFARHQTAGRPRDTFLLGHNVPRDPWQLLWSFDPTIDTRRIGATHQEWKTEYQPVSSTPANAADCADIPDPYNWTQPPWLGTTSPFCLSRGFSYASASEQWSGTQPPPSSFSNVQTRSEVLEVDEHGNVLRARNENDRHVADDDVCVEMSYAKPTETSRIVSALATRRTTDCQEPIGERRTLRIDTWEYDGLTPGWVTDGNITSHSVERFATDSGQSLGTIREYEASYDAVGNVEYFVTAREDGAVRALELFYDNYGLVSVGSRLDASGLSPVETTTTHDPLTLAVLEQTDANGTTWGRELDGLGRETRTTVTPPGGSIGITSTTTYAGFSSVPSPDPTGRVVTTAQFTDPVPPGAMGNERGRETVAYLDELGRTRRVEQRLGSDYADEALVTVRRYDGLGRTSFETDPHPTNQSTESAYGTTYHYGTDGVLRCSIRGHGPQAFTTVSDLAAERFPTCQTRVFTNHTVQISVSSPDSLAAGSPQAGIVRTDTMTAIGRVTSRETLQGANRLELATFTYDPLGQLASLSRYRNPAASSDSVTFSFRYDSLGQKLASMEPEMAARFHAYSNWGELLSVEWTDTTSSPAVPMRLEQSYDALGRITKSAERENGVVLADTEYAWFYDTDQGTPLPSSTFTTGRLTRTSSKIGDTFLSYDAFGRVESRAIVDLKDEAYIEKYERHFDGSLAALEFQLSDTGYTPERYLYAYDSAAALRTVDYDSAQNPRRLFEATTIDPFGRVRAATYDGGAITVSANHADLGRRLPIEQVITIAGESRRISHDIYDAVGRELERYEEIDGTNKASTTSTYDVLGRLHTSVQTASPQQLFNTAFTYDALGNVKSLADSVGSNLVNLTYSPAPADIDRICRIDYGPSVTGPCNVAHDGSGNIVQQPTRDGVARKLTYFPSGAIRNIIQGDVSATFRYDGSGEISELDVVGDTDSRRDRRYGLVERRTLAGSSESIIVRQIPGAGSRRGADGPWIFPFSEDRGTRLTGKDGEFVQAVNYLPFGAATSTGAAPGTAEYTSAQWNGGDALADLGIVQVGARLYDPAIGRFLSRDPLIIPRSATTTNPYSFAVNDPINFTDPTGMDCESSTGPCNSAPIILPTGIGGFGDSDDAKAGPQLLPPTVGTLGRAANAFDAVWDLVHEYHPLELNKRFLMRAFGVATGKVTLGGALRAQVGDTATVASALSPGGTLVHALRGGVIAGVGTAIETGSLEKGAGVGVLSTLGARIIDNPATRRILAAVAGLRGGGASHVASGPVRAGEAGRYSLLKARDVVGDDLTPHHMPQVAQGFTSRAEGGALVMTKVEHAMTRNYGYAGRVTARDEAGMSFRDVLARDIRDVRQIVGSKYNQGLRDLLRYYYEHFPDLIRRRE